MADVNGENSRGAGGEPLSAVQQFTHMVDGAPFVLDAPTTVPCIWGRGDEVIWAGGEIAHDRWTSRCREDHPFGATRARQARFARHTARIPSRADVRPRLVPGDGPASPDRTIAEAAFPR
jgi:hypothetical protein